MKSRVEDVEMIRTEWYEKYDTLHRTLLRDMLCGVLCHIFSYAILLLVLVEHI